MKDTGNCGEKSLRVVVYCSSRSGLPEGVEKGATLIGEAIGKAGGTLVYGGVNAGLMHVVAESAARAGARIVGVVPEVFRHRADPLCSEVILASDLNDRKGRMIEMGDIFVVLPGGLGTIDEWVSTLSHILVAERVDPSADRPILVWNHSGIYDGMISQLKETGDSEYARGKRIDRSIILPTPEEVATQILSARMAD